MYRHFTVPLVWLARLYFELVKIIFYSYKLRALQPDLGSSESPPQLQ